MAANSKKKFLLDSNFFLKVEESEVGSKEECANRTMSNLIRQLASLGQHATSIFDGLESIAENIQNRAQELSKRAVQVEDLLNVSIHFVNK